MKKKRDTYFGPFFGRNYPGFGPGETPLTMSAKDMERLNRVNEFIPANFRYGKLDIGYGNPIDIKEMVDTPQGLKFKVTDTEGNEALWPVSKVRRMLMEADMIQERYIESAEWLNDILYEKHQYAFDEVFNESLTEEEIWKKAKEQFPVEAELVMDTYVRRFSKEHKPWPYSPHGYAP